MACGFKKLPVVWVGMDAHLPVLQDVANASCIDHCKDGAVLGKAAVLEGATGLELCTQPPTCFHQAAVQEQAM